MHHPLMDVALSLGPAIPAPLSATLGPVIGASCEQGLAARRASQFSGCSAGAICGKHRGRDLGSPGGPLGLGPSSGPASRHRVMGHGNAYHAAKGGKNSTKAVRYTLYTCSRRTHHVRCATLHVVNTERN